MYDRRDGVSEVSPLPSPPSSLTDTHRIQSHTLLTNTILTFMYTQVLWCLSRLTRSRVSDVTMDPDYSFYPRNPVYARRLDSSVLVISLSLHRHPFVCILFSSRFTCYNKSPSPMLRKFNFHNMIVVSSTSDKRLFLLSSKTGLVCLSPKLKLYVST
jgi:hypothetical protein